MNDFVGALRIMRTIENFWKQDYPKNVSNLSVAKANVLGGEVALWAEQADAATMMSR